MTAKRLIIDARKLGDGGIGVYLENLLRGLAKLCKPQEILLTVLVEPSRLERGSIEGESTDANLVLEELRGVAQLVPDAVGKYSFGEYLVRFRHAQLFRSGPVVFHAPHYTLPFLTAPFTTGFFLRQRPVAKTVAAVVTIHDAIHVTHPDSVFHRIVGRTLIASAVGRAARVITVSNASRNVLVELVPSAAKKIVVIPNALREGIRKRPEEEVSRFYGAYGLPRGALLFIGVNRPHKGFGRLLRAWSLLPESFRPPLIVVGSRFEETQNRLSQEGLDNQIRFLSSVDTQSLSLLYSGARALVLPSDVEGFGLPALEALACGAPVVSTPLPSVTEITQGLSWTAPDFTAEAFSAVLLELLRTPQSASELSRRREAGIKRALEFSIQTTTAQTIDVYREFWG